MAADSTAISIEYEIHKSQKSMIMARGVYIGFSLSQRKRRSVRIPAAVRKAPIGELTISILSTP
jgi:acyl-CoA thioesterase FadM